MVRGLESLVGGVLIALSAWMLVERGGRRLREVLPDPDPGRAVGQVSSADTGQEVRQRVRVLRRHAAGHRSEGDVRVVVLQVVALLKAGLSPGMAWSRTVGAGVDLTGVPDAGALAQVLGARHAEAVVVATRLALEVGAPLGRVLEQLAETLVAEAESQAERDAVLAAPRTTARLLMWLPVLGGFLGWVLGADPMATAMDGGTGSVAVGIGVALLVIGRLWSDRLVDAAVGIDPPGVDIQVVLELVAAAVRAGAGVPRALEATGNAIGGPEGDALTRVAHALVLGSPWERAWADIPAAFGPLAHALRGAWQDGAAPSEALRAAGEEIRRERRSSTRTAAARLGVRLVLPLGICYLPAFVLVGLIPVLLALGIDLLT